MTITNKKTQENLIKYCTKIGKNTMLVQGAGGNVSWKEGPNLWIKSSGTCLADANVQDIFIPVDLQKIKKEIKNNNNFEINPVILTVTDAKPSIETAFHALLPFKIVIHLHSVNSLVYLIKKNPKRILKKLLTSICGLEFIKYVKPGAELAKDIFNALNNNKKANLYLLQNHGLIICSDSLIEAINLVDKVDNKLRSKITINIKQEKFQSKNISYSNIKDAELNLLSTNPFLYNCIQKKWAIYPDHIVFLGKKANCFNCWESFNNSLKTNNEPDLIFIKNMGVFVTKRFNKQQFLQLRLYFDVMIRQNNIDNIKTLTNEKINELLEWDSENYRKKLFNAKNIND